MNPIPSAPTKVWSRYVAIGDSFTEGMSDPDPENDNAYIGWADRLAESLHDLAGLEHLPFRYANLAVRGRLLADVVGPQARQGRADGARPRLDGRRRQRPAAPQRRHQPGSWTPSRPR